MIDGSEEIKIIEQAHSSRLSSFLTLAAVLLRAQSPQVVSQLVVNAAPDLCHRLIFSALYQPDSPDNSTTAQINGILLPPGEATRLETRLLVLLPPESERANRVCERVATAEIEAELMVRRVYYFPAYTPTQFYGWLVVGTTQPLDSEELYYLRSLAQLSAIALETAARFEALKDSAAETTLINEVASALATSLNAEELFYTFMTYLRNLLSIERATIALLSPDWSQYELTYSWTDPPARVRRGYIKNLPLSGSVLERSIREREIVIDPFDLPQGNEEPFFKVIDGSRLIVPLLAKGQPIGALQIASRIAGCYRENDAQLLLVEKLARLFALALVNSRLYEEKQLSAEFDSRVGVYNHDYFDRELSVQVDKARRMGYKLGLVMLDMDNLKQVNDVHGHLAGDAALRHIAGLVSETVRATDVVARYGGDEFGVMLPGCTARSLEIVSEKARRTINNTPLELENGTTIKLTVSIGAALFPDDADTPLELMKRADSAMYVAKQHRNEVRIGRKSRLARVSERELHRGTPETSPVVNADNDSVELPESDELNPNTENWIAADYERFLNWLGGDRPGVAARLLRETYQQLAQTRQQLRESEVRLTQVEEGMWHGLRLAALSVEQREPYLTGGAERLHRLCLLLANELNLSQEQITELEIASWLANLGRLAIPEYIWSKTGQFSPYDRRRVQQVPIETARLAEQWKPLVTSGVVLALRYQRERFDGLGYPKGLAGEEIPLSARILGLAVAVVALHQPRPFRSARPLSVIHSEVEQAAGRHFDPQLAQIMLRLIDSGQLVFLN